MRKMQLIVPLRLRKMIFTLVLAIASSVWMTNEASNWCMPAAQTSTEQPIRIGGTFQTDIFPCVDETEPCPPCLTIVLASGGHYYLVSDDPQVLAILDTISTGSFAIIEGNHYLEGHYDFIHVTHIFFPETDITQLTGEWEVYKETVSTPTGDAGTRWFSTHDVNNTNYIIENNSIYKVVLDQASGYAHYSDIVPYSIDKKENGTWLLTAEGMFSSSDPVGEGIPTPVTIYKLTENEIEWMYAANGGDEGPNFYYQYLRRNTYAQNDKLPSLCDEWNVLHEPFSCDGIYCRLQTFVYRLTTDTLIQDVNYVKLMEQEGSNTYYEGAMREGTNRDIYYVPANSTHEYLLYAFNAQVGDTLSNLWVGGFGRDYQGVVQAISNGSPRIFTIGVKFGDESDDYLYPIRWIEGVGSPETPMGMAVVPDVPADIGVYTLLCAYKNGEQVYTSTMGEQYGCVYNYDPYAAPSDTIPLYTFTGDDPGSSTVDPVDPNQVVVTLKGDELTIKESSGETILYRLTNTSSDAASAPYRVPQAQTPQSFQNEINITLTEEGTYSLILTNPDWGYGIYGTFSYPNRKDAIDNTPSPSKENQGKVSKLILSDGQILILRGEKIYTIQGQRVK